MNSITTISLTETIAASLKFIAFCFKSRQKLQRFGSFQNLYLKNTNIDKYHIFGCIFLLTSIPCETSILSYASIYNSYKHSSRKTCG